jgi:SHS2 domain-containing protein
MVGDTDDDRRARRAGEGGHRAVPHTADTRIEAWGPSLERCLAEAVTAMVECFADTSGVHPTAVRRLRLTEEDGQGGEGYQGYQGYQGYEDRLAVLLDEVIFRLEVDGEVPVDVEAERADGDLDVRLSMADVASVQVVGAVPKAVSWNELRLAPDAYGWSCAATVDV